MALLTLALLIDRVFGDPDWLWRRLPHPVVMFGAIISWFDQRRSKRGAPFGWGVSMIVAFAAVSLIGWGLVGGLALVSPWAAWLLELIIVVVLIAQKSLLVHVAAVAHGLNRDIQDGRDAVAMIVGRDVDVLGEDGVARAAIESLAENASDGIVAPVFWYAVGGLPGLLFYKLVNTADSMVGHRTPEYEQFGKASAVVDDVLNVIPARLTAGLVAAWRWLSNARIAGLWPVLRNDATRHRSPNAGWPEGAFAWALGIALGGPRRYGDDEVEGVWLNGDGRRKLTSADIGAALTLCRRTFDGLFVICGGLALVVYLTA